MDALKVLEDMEILTLSNTYQDSVKLMRIANQTREEYGVEEAVAMMGTQENKDLLSEMGEFDAADIDALRPDDLILAVADPDQETAKAAVANMEAEVKGTQDREEAESRERRAPKGLHGALDRHPSANLALISVPGEYATREAWKALQEGLNVHIFSDNVGIEHERRLKAYGRDRGQLVMGPDCGTAIINGAPLGFANSVDTGQVGVVSAAGSGLQEVTSLLDRAGVGVSQAIGTGGRDLKDTIGGTTMRQGLEMLTEDEETEVVVLVSKPPDEETMNELLDDVAACEKPVVVEFVGSDPDPIAAAGATPSASLADAARQAVRLLPGGEDRSISFDAGVEAFTGPGSAEEILEDRGQPGSGRRWVRGLYSGGTLATEAGVLLGDTVPEIGTNVGLGEPVADPLDPAGHAIIDLGVDEFTRNRPHPMIDSTVRDEQLAETLADDSVAVVLLDVILGHGAHEDPAAPVADVLAEGGDDWPVVVGSVVGTRSDPQDWERQIQTLTEAGVHVAESNAAAVELARAVHRAVAENGGSHR